MKTSIEQMAASYDCPWCTDSFQLMNAFIGEKIKTQVKAATKVHKLLEGEEVRAIDFNLSLLDLLGTDKYNEFEEACEVGVEKITVMSCGLAYIKIQSKYDCHVWVEYLIPSETIDEILSE